MARSKVNIDAGLCFKGLHPWIEGQKHCKECARDWQKANPERVNKNNRRWQLANSEQFRESKRKSTRKSRLKVYGLVPEDAPDNCQLCGEGNGKRAMYADHCHATGRFRGFICRRCNSILGFAKDNPALLEKLALYLRENI